VRHPDAGAGPVGAPERLPIAVVAPEVVAGAGAVAMGEMRPGAGARWYATGR
jgi:hypothetical protein